MCRRLACNALPLGALDGAVRPQGLRCTPPAFPAARSARGGRVSKAAEATQMHAPPGSLHVACRAGGPRETRREAAVPFCARPSAASEGGT